MSPSEANESIIKFSGECGNLASELGLNVLVLSHLNAPPKDKLQHEQGAQCLPSQMTGSKALTRDCAYGVGFERNSQDDGIDKNRSYTTLTKVRDYSIDKNRFKTYYDSDTTRIIEREWEGDSLQPPKKRQGSSGGFGS